MKKVQIDYELFRKLIFYHLGSDDQYEEDIRNGLEEKLDALVRHLADILTVGDLEERVAVVDELMKESKIAFLRNYVARKRKEGLSHGEER